MTVWVVTEESELDEDAAEIRGVFAAEHSAYDWCNTEGSVCPFSGATGWVARWVANTLVVGWSRLDGSVNEHHRYRVKRYEVQP